MAKQPVLNTVMPAIGQIRMSACHGETAYEEGITPVEGTHIHSCYELYVNVSGDVSFLHDRDIYDIQPGDVILSCPSDVHYCIYRASCFHDHFCVWFSDGAIGDFLSRRHLRGRIRPSGESRERMLQLLHTLCAADVDPFLQTATLLELVTLLDTGESKDATEKTSDRLSAVLRYVDEHLTEINGISEVAQAFFLSDSTLNRMFRTQLGISFGKYLEAQRLALSERLLRADHSVTEACFLSGFTDCSRFIAKFKDKFGTTPLKYKKRRFHTNTSDE